MHSHDTHCSAGTVDADVTFSWIRSGTVKGGQKQQTGVAQSSSILSGQRMPNSSQVLPTIVHVGPTSGHVVFSLLAKSLFRLQENIGPDFSRNNLANIRLVLPASWNQGRPSLAGIGQHQVTSCQSWSKVVDRARQRATSGRPTFTQAGQLWSSSGQTLPDLDKLAQILPTPCANFTRHRTTVVHLQAKH